MSIPNIPYNPMKNQSHKPRNKRREAQRNHRERQTTISQRASRPIESLLLPLVLCRLLYPGIGQGLPICPCWKQFQRLFMDFEPDPSNAPSRIGRFIEKDSLTRLRLVQTDFCGAIIVMNTISIPSNCTPFPHDFQSHPEVPRKNRAP